MERGWIGMFRRTQKAAMPKSMAHISLGWIKMGAGAGARKALNPPATKAYARKGSERIVSGLYPSAFKGLPWRSWCRARRLPQPGQW